ncbi:MAG: ABC transporter ATP-binding protein [Candidatus Acidiferrales bacterium]
MPQVAPNEHAAIEVVSLGKSFGPVRAVHDLSFDVHAGEIFGLVGPDGAGKTTTMRMLAGVLPPDSGRASVSGFDIATNPEGAKHDLSYMPQRFGLYDDLTVTENIAFYADLFSVKRAERDTRATSLLQAAGLSEFGARLAGKLSGGMKQKLGLVCALIHQPDVILLDEPTNGVDPVSRRDFWKILYSLVDQGVAILISTSYLDEAERCHRVGLIHQGRMLLLDTPAALKKGFPGAVLAVHTIDPPRAREALAGAPGVRSVILEGDGVHLFVDRADRLAELRVRLESAGVPFISFESTDPTIEDLFVSEVTEKPVEPNSPSTAGPGATSGAGLDPGMPS